MSKKKTELEKQKEQKRVAYYQTFLTTWVQNRMEFDKQLIILSTAGLGMLIFFHKEIKERPEQILWIFAGGFFIVTIGLILYTFHTNSDYIRCFLDEDNEETAEEKKLNRRLEILTIVSRFSFILAVLATFVLAMLSVFMVTIYEMFCK